MKLSQCRHGVIVQKKEAGCGTAHREVGMVIGITNNLESVLSDECRDPFNAVPLVQWQSGRSYPIHPKNIDLYKD